MKHLLFKAAAVAAAMSLAACGGAQAAVIFGDASTQVTAVATANSSYRQDYSPTGTLSSFTSVPLSVQTSVAAADAENEVVLAEATDDITGTASFTDSADGYFKFGGSTSAAVDIVGDATAGDGGFADYDFSISSPSEFSLGVNLSGVSSEDAGVFLVNTTTNSDVFTDIYITTSENRDFYLTPGSYSFSAESASDDYISQSGIGAKVGYENETFSFSISAAPEPSAWALMIAGVSVAGLALRRRRPGAALAAG